MKKLIFLLMFIFNILCYANWEIKEDKDEFGDGIGKFSIDMEIEKDFFMNMTKERIMFTMFDYTSKITKEEGIIKFKIDKNEPIILKACFEEDHVISSINTRNLENSDKFASIVEEMKKGKILKMVIEKNHIKEKLIKLDLKGFTESYNKINLL